MCVLPYVGVFTIVRWAELGTIKFPMRKTTSVLSPPCSKILDEIEKVLRQIPIYTILILLTAVV